MFTDNKSLVSNLRYTVECKSLSVAKYCYEINIILSDITKEPLYSWLNALHDDLYMIMYINIDVMHYRNEKMTILYKTKTEIVFSTYIPRIDQYSTNSLIKIVEKISNAKTKYKIELRDNRKNFHCIKLIAE